MLLHNALKEYARHCAIALLLVCTTCGAAVGRDAVPDTVIDGLEWSLIGPYRGGRVTTVTGVEGKPNLYYMGATGGDSSDLPSVLAATNTRYLPSGLKSG